MNYNDLEDMVFRMNLTYNEKEYIIEEKFVGAEHRSFSTQPGIYEIREVNDTLKSVSPENVKINNTANDITMEGVMTVHAKKS